MTAKQYIVDQAGFRLAELASSVKDDDVAISDDQSFLLDHFYRSGVNKIAINSGFMIPDDVREYNGITYSANGFVLTNVAKELMKLEGFDRQILVMNDIVSSEIIYFTDVTSARMTIGYKDLNVAIIGNSSVPIDIGDIMIKSFTVNGIVKNLLIVATEQDYLPEGFSVPDEMQDALIYFVMSEFLKLKPKYFSIASEYRQSFESDKKEFRFTRTQKNVNNSGYVPFM